MSAKRRSGRFVCRADISAARRLRFGLFERLLLRGDVGLNRIRAALPPAPELVDEARKRVDAEEHEDRERRVARDHDECDREDDDGPEGDRAHDGVALPGEEGGVAHHREARVERHDEGKRALVHDEPVGELVLNGQPHEAADERRSGRRGQTLEVVLAHDADIDVEARETQNGAEGINEGACPAELAQVDERVLVDDERGGNTEAHRVGKTVHLHAELGLRVRQARNTPVHAVKEHGEENGDRRRGEVAVHRLDDAVEGGKESRRGKGVRQDVDALAAHGLETTVADARKTFAPGCAAVRVCCHVG